MIKNLLIWKLKKLKLKKSWGWLGGWWIGG
jgi:hypothetical protein